MNYELAKAHRILAAFYVAMFVLYSLYFAVGYPASFWSVVGLFAAIVGALSCLHLVAAAGVERSRLWGRILSVAFGIVLLVGFPIGTAIGVYLLYLAVNNWEAPQPGVA